MCALFPGWEKSAADQKGNGGLLIQRVQGSNPCAHQIHQDVLRFTEAALAGKSPWLRVHAMSTMHVAGLRAMGIKKFIGASYSALQNKIVLDYITKAGFRVLSMEPIDVPFDQVAQISVETLYAHVKKLYRKDPAADGIYIQGGGWQTVRVVEMLEKDLDVPVVHATICQAWQIHKRLRVRDTKPGLGRLLAELP